VIGPIHRERGRAVQELAVTAVVAAEQEAHAGELVLRPAEQVMAPGGEQQLVIRVTGRIRTSRSGRSSTASQ
jgi:hypothetical protein